MTIIMAQPNSRTASTHTRMITINLTSLLIPRRMAYCRTSIHSKAHDRRQQLTMIIGLYCATSITLKKFTWLNFVNMGVIREGLHLPYNMLGLIQKITLVIIQNKHVIITEARKNVSTSEPE